MLAGMVAFVVVAGVALLIIGPALDEFFWVTPLTTGRPADVSARALDGLRGRLFR